MVVVLQIVEPVFRSDRYSRVHDTCERRPDVGRGRDYGDGEPGGWRFLRVRGSAQSEQTDVPLVFSSPNDSTHTNCCYSKTDDIILFLSVVIIIIFL